MPYLQEAKDELDADFAASFDVPGIEADSRASRELRHRIRKAQKNTKANLVGLLPLIRSRVGQSVVSCRASAAARTSQ